MVIELENTNKNLQSQLNDLKIVNQRLHNQISYLELDRDSLKFKLKENSELVGFSLKTNLRGLSTDEGKIPVLKYIVENVGKNATILDVGFGAGAYGKLQDLFIIKI